MKFLVCGDVHWSKNSSIVRKQGSSKYSERLSNLINSVNWVEQISKDKGCDGIIYLGDFFDQESLNSQEISALQEIVWNDSAEHVFLCGNHEMGLNDLTYNSANIFNLKNNVSVITKPTVYTIDGGKFFFLPYILESERKSIEEIFGDLTSDTSLPKICFSHNDIKGIQMGAFLSVSGFSIEELSQFDVVYNGHLHNGQKITDKIYNVGNLTGQNFSEDAYKYAHNIFIIDSQTNYCVPEIIENPYAFNFYKLDLSKCNNIDVIKNRLNDLKDNAVVSITAGTKFLSDIKSILENIAHISESRLVGINEQIYDDTSNSKVELTQVDHLKEFQEYVLTNMGENNIVIEELKEVTA